MFLNENAGNRLRDLVDDIIDHWREGQPPDALSAIAKYPELQQHHSLAVDLAYEEYCLREESGEPPDAEEFCNRFSRIRYSLNRMLNLHGVLRSKSLGIHPKDLIEWPKVGEYWLEWELVEEIGRGAFSRVFLAREPAIGNRQVVVKCSRAGPSEAFVLGKLSHPNVMPIHTVRPDQSRGLIGICMPYVGRMTLGDVLDRLNQDDCEATPDLFNPGESAITNDATGEPAGASYSLAVARIIGKVADGLAAAHRVNVLHGDLKPSNIILSFAGEPLLVDFNLAEDGEAADRIGGTPPYMAPERLALLSLPGMNQDRPNDSGYCSDVFSLGVVLYELLFGDQPYDFEVEDLEAGYRQVDFVPTKNRRNLADESVPQELRDIVDSAIALDPEDRCPSAQAFADRIAQFVARLTPPARQIAPATITWQFSAYLLAMSLLLTVAALWAIGLFETSPLQQTLRNIRANDYVRASERLEAANKSNPSPELQAWLGYCFVKMHKFDRARAHFVKAKPDEDPTGILWHNIGCCDLNLSQSSRAIECFSRALDRDPYLGKAYQERAMAKALEAQKRNLPPIEGTFYDDIVAAISLEPDGPYLYGDAALIYSFGLRAKIDVHSEAKESVRKALRMGVAPKGLAEMFPPEFEFSRLIPDPLPPEVPHDFTMSFIPPPYDLEKIWPTKTSPE